MKCAICGAKIEKENSFLLERHNIILCLNCFPIYVFKCDGCNEYELVSNMFVKFDRDFGVLLFCRDCVKKAHLINSESFDSFQVPKYNFEKEELK